MKDEKECQQSRCLNCDKELNRKQQKYCSNKCKYTDNLNRTVTITGKVANGTKTYTATLEKSNSVVQKAAKVEKQVGNEIQQTTKHIKNQAFAMCLL